MRPELLVVGGGPAGAAAALWGRSFGWRVRLLERGSSAGGQLLHVHFAPLNYPAGVAGDGVALAGRMRQQLEAAGVDVIYGAEATALEPGTPAVRTAESGREEGDAVLIATGVRRRALEVPGERELDGRGVSYSATQDRARFAGEDVVVVGGGDAAFENALLLADVGCRVSLVVRGRSRARADFRERVGARSGIEVVEQTRVVAIEGDQAVSAVRLDGERGVYSIPVAGVVIKIGVRPNTEWCRDAIECDAEGYVLVDETLATSDPRVWAAGDVTRPPLLGMTVATGQGSLAVASIREVFRS